MCEEQLGYHHRPVGLDFIPCEVKVLNGRALVQSLCYDLRSGTLQPVALYVQTEQALGTTNQFAQISSSSV